MAKARRFQRMSKLVALVLTALVIGPDLPAYPQIERVSLSPTGAELDSASFTESRQALSGDGRYVVFTTFASTLTAPISWQTQIALRDRKTGELELVSRGDEGAVGNNNSKRAVVSSDGRYVAFDSQADNLVPGDANGQNDVFVYDRTTRHMDRVSIRSDGQEADAASFSATISDDGRYVAFVSQATNLADVQAEYNLFVHDRLTRQTELVSRSAAGMPANGNSSTGAISGNGRFVAFESYGTNLTPAGVGGIFLRDLTKGTVELVSLADSGEPAQGLSLLPSISGDGSKIAFVSNALNLRRDRFHGDYHVFVRDVTAKKTMQVDTSAAGVPGASYAGEPAISRDGSTVAFVSTARELTPHQAPGENGEIYVKHLESGAIRLASVTRTGLAAGGINEAPSLTTDGRCVAFNADDANLVPGDTNNWFDVFISGPN